MPRTVTKSEVIIWRNKPPGANRLSYFSLTSQSNQPFWPGKSPESPMSLEYYRCANPGTVYTLPNPRNFDFEPDMLNVNSAFQVQSAVMDSRLYAGVYARFADKARRGKAEMGMVFVQRQKAYKLLIDTIVLASTVMLATKAKFPKGVKYLGANPSTTPRKARKLTSRHMTALRKARSKAEQKRLSNLIFLWKEVSGALLAVRYGVLPLLGSIASAAHTLSGDIDDETPVRVRTTGKATRSWGKSLPPTAIGMRSEKGVLKQTITIAATARVSNPDLLLANRLGLTNPQYWIWDATPWSFVLDWFFPVGTFLNSLTATLGLAFNNSSTTWTIVYDGTGDVFNIVTPSGAPVVMGSCTAIVIHKRKTRTLGTPPMPTNVPYGTGLSTMRGQNALALIMQNFTPKRG